MLMFSAGRNSGLTAGVSISLTGKYARQGLDAFYGLQLWADQAGAKLQFYDDESRRSRTIENVRRLLVQDRVALLFGPYSSGLARTAAQVAEEYGRVMWNHGGASDDISSRWVVSTLSPASCYLRGFPAWLAKNAPGEREITLMRSQNSTFAGYVARGFVEEAQAAGLSVELLPLPAAARRKAPVLVLSGSFEDELEMIRLRPPTRCIAAVSAGVRTFGDELGTLSEGVIGPSQWEPDPESEWFVRSFKARFGVPPEYSAASAYATGLVIEECARRSQSLEDRRLRIAAAHLDFQTFYGKFRIDPESGRQIAHRIVLVQWKHGRKMVAG